MSRDAYKGPKLPQSLLDRVGTNDDSRFKQNGGARKAKRKAERQQKKVARSQPSPPQRKVFKRRKDVESDDGDDDVNEEEEVVPPPRPRKKVEKDVQPLKSILKKNPQAKAVEAGSIDDEDEDEVPAPPIVSRAVKSRLEDDDAEIAALEKKLGVRGKKSTAPDEDGLDWLAGGSGSEDDLGSLKRKRPEDSKWLRDKRLKASGGDDQIEVDESSADELAESDDEQLANPFSDDEVGSEDFDGFEPEERLAPRKRQRENPYVAPVTRDAAPVAKYIPPSMRKPAASDEEALRQLRRQINGLLNRLSEANMLSILQSLEDIYTRNARQHVTSTLVDLLVSLVSDPSVLNDTFLILHAGFAAAVYKVTGTDFGAQVLEKTTQNIDHFRLPTTTSGKQPLNLLAFLSFLHNLQLVGPAILFDYIRLLLDTISEPNTELLLRIIRVSGQQLRQDDPSALKDIVLLLQRSTASIGADNLSVRTKFMIETIQNLKNNRLKTGVAGSTLTAEHLAAMKRVMTTLNTTRAIKATEPLRVSLADIRDSEKKGKWWLVGASYHDPSKLARSEANDTTSTSSRSHDQDAGYESETPGAVNLARLARAQGMNTDVRRAIFISLLSSSDYNEAHLKILKLHLKNKQQLEMPRVLVHCVGAEETYNPFYALVARKFCGERRARKAFMFTLWDTLKKLEAKGEEDEGEGEGEGEGMGVRKVVNVAKFFGFLIAERGLSLAVLKKLEPDFPYLASDTTMFVEVLLNTIFLQARKSGAKQGNSNEVQADSSDSYAATIKAIFLSASGAQTVIPALKFVLEEKVAKAELVRTKKEKRAVVRGCEVAVGALEEAGKPAASGSDDEDEGSEMSEAERG
ncbi:suppressor of glycerol defect [Extremus antarcticus]|uniref:Suppressor of glycerol defect n=1 Tax=Extremus antarcticus TaxID=702011 RepID=A0AAJ0LWX3_9PEZI|nr:suppressor of glycerol defect [Extremus antarcticus]